MDSAFAHLRQRDTSVSMLRVKMSRRRSQSQKENRERVVNTRRQLAELPELEMSSLDASIATVNISNIQGKTLNNGKSAKDVAGEERLKQLARWKERKALEKEKEKRERKGVFKTGMYHPKDTLTIPSLPVVPAASTRAKETKMSSTSSQSVRVTRSMKQQQQIERTTFLQPLAVQDPKTLAKKAQAALDRTTRSRVAPVKRAPAPATAKIHDSAVEPAVRALRSKSASRPAVTAAPVVAKDKPMDVRTTRSRAFINHVAPFSYRENDCKAVEADVTMESQETPRPPGPAPSSEEQNVAVEAPAVAVEEASSFAPKGFMFKAPVGLSSFKFEPLTPRSADAFLTPSPSFSLPEVPAFNLQPPGEPSDSSPSKSPRRSPPREAPATTGSPLESKRGVPYFRLEIASETEGLMTLCADWEPKVEDESIPEEMRDRMRTAVGQARLLMKERFKQFSGLVEDCELGRGEKITTCTDLQGFWDMVYYQVEDVHKKFNALKVAEGRGWVEEHEPPPPRQRKGVKKPPSAAPAKATGTNQAARSRLAAVKAAMKAKQQAAEAEKAAKDAGAAVEDAGPSSEESESRAEPPATVVFDGGFFQVESPAKPPGSLRRAGRPSAAALPQTPPCSNYLSPRRSTRRCLALPQTPLLTAASPARPRHMPARLTLDQAPASPRGTPRASRHRASNSSLCFSPARDAAAVQGDAAAVQGDAALALREPAAEHSLPSICVAEEPAAVCVDLPRSPCRTPQRSLSPSFSLSPSVTPSWPPTSSPPAVLSLEEAQESVCLTPGTLVVEEIPGLDFERYLLPSQRSSLSPGGLDVEMESPRGQTEDLLTLPEHALPAVGSALNLQSPQSTMLLFTPDLKDRIRQSVCPSDLMVFTPPL
ncbi:disks large-associated protein 5 isoform X2 [Gasterosteus aculeatus]